MAHLQIAIPVWKQFILYKHSYSTSHKHVHKQKYTDNTRL